MKKIIYSILFIILFIIYIYNNKYYGILIESGSEEFINMLNRLNIYDMIDIDDNYFKLKKEWSNKLIVDFNTLNLHTMMKKYDINDDITIEILLCLLNSPIINKYKDLDELETEINIRKNIVKYGYITHVNFNTNSDIRSNKYFNGVKLLPNRSLILGIKENLLPSISGKIYDFSCYRVTEQLILLAILIEAKNKYPELLNKIEDRWRIEPIKSNLFHTIFLNEHGSKFFPIPLNYYVPGDRVWFKNPDDRSSDIIGYEGKWTIYLNNGLFGDFWKNNGNINNQFTIENIMIEIYNWRHSIINIDNIDYIDEDIVQQLNKNTNNNIIDQMYKYNIMGGCIDMTREKILDLMKIYNNIK